jgi:outer membrane protein TolC
MTLVGGTPPPWRGTTACAATGEAEPLTLVQVVQRALTGNVDLQRERIQVAISAANVRVAEGQFDLVLSGDASFGHQVTPPLTALGELAASSADTTIFDAQLSRALESGGQLALSAQGAHSSTTSAFQCGLTATHCDIFLGDLKLTLTQPLLRGFGAAVATAPLRQQRIQHDQASLNRQARAANVIRDAVNAYWELAYQTEDLAIRRAAVERANDQLLLTQAEINVGRAGTLALAAVQRAIADRAQDVAESEQNLLLRALDLQRLFGAPAPVVFAGYRAAEIPRVGARAVDVGAAVERALDASPALNALKLGMKLSAIDRAVAQASLRPQIDFVGSVGTTGRNTELGETARQTFRMENAVWSAGLNFQMPVQNRVALGHADAAGLADERAQLEAADLELAIRDGAARLAARIQAAGRRIELARAAVGFANENLKAEKARFSVGQSTNNDVLLRQQELNEAEIKVARATVDLLVNDTALLALTGEIFDRYGFVLKGI